MRAFCAALSLLLLAGHARAETSHETEAQVAPAIRVTTDPPAELSVDGHDCGVTPAFVEVAPGRHEIVLTLWGRTYSTTVVAVAGEVTELRMRLGGGSEAERAARREAIRARRRHDARPERREPWPRRTPAWPVVEVEFVGGPAFRSFSVAIDSMVDAPRHRSRASFDSGLFGFVGFRLAAFPLARSSTETLRGLGVEGGAAWGVGIEVFDPELEIFLDTAFFEASAGLVYNLVLGGLDRGITLFTRLGWQRTSFEVGDFGNDLVPPFRYESIRLEGGLTVPLGTRHLSLELAVAYLATPTVGATAERVYSGEGSPTTCHGGEVRGALEVRIGGFEIGAGWVSRLFKSDFDGVGEGWGLMPTTRTTEGRNGIRTTGFGRDGYHEARVYLGYRY